MQRFRKAADEVGIFYDSHKFGSRTSNQPVFLHVINSHHAAIAVHSSNSTDTEFPEVRRISSVPFIYRDSWADSEPRGETGGE